MSTADRRITVNIDHRSIKLIVWGIVLFRGLELMETVVIHVINMVT